MSARTESKLAAIDVVPRQPKNNLEPLLKELTAMSFGPVTSFEMVYSSDYYDEADYIRDWDSYVEFDQSR